MHYQHKIKCLACSLHFIVLSDREDWPPEKTLSTGPAVVYCPECGSTNEKLRWRAEEHDEFIFQVVPGETHHMELH